MSTYSDRVNRALTQTELGDIELSLDSIEQTLSFLRTLTPSEKSSKIRLAVNNWGFVRAAKDAYDDMPDLLPRYIDGTAYENDLALLDQLRAVSIRIEQISYLIKDSEILLGDLVYKDSLGMFQGAGEAKKRGTARARLWFERLRTRFYGQGSRRSDESEAGSSDQVLPAPQADDDPVMGGSSDIPQGNSSDGPQGNNSDSPSGPVDPSPVDANPTISPDSGMNNTGGTPLNPNSDPSSGPNLGTTDS